MRANKRSGSSHASLQLGLFKPRGGKRRGAGRPPKGVKAGASHAARPDAKLAGWQIDGFSSAAMFPDWAESGDELWRGPATDEPLLVWRPRSWLLREGWKRHGASLSCFEVPARG